MADNQQQTTSWFTGGNRRQNQFINYYEQILGQLTQNPNTITAQIIAAPDKIQAQQITAPDKIQAERINVDQRTYGDYADEAASYLQKYLDNSIAARRRQTTEARALADVDAYARGFGNGSTWLTDAKNRMTAQEASDIMAARNEFLGKVGEQAYNAMQAQYARVLQADMQNAANQLTADQQNAYYNNLVQQFNANALMDVDKYNSNMLLEIAMQNAANQLNADQFNANLMQQLQQLAWQYAQNLQSLKGGGGGGKQQGDVETNEDTPNEEAPSNGDTEVDGGLPPITVPEDILLPPVIATPGFGNGGR